jgi:putative pyruvate formate lyase activating enzyme
LALLDGVVDIYMPDFKYADAETALQYSRAKDYPQAAKAALREMHRQVGDLTIDERGIAVRGLLVRHLVLPENIAGTGEIVRFIAREISTDTYLNIMDQYCPHHKAQENPPLDRRITNREYMAAIDLARKAGMKRIAGVTA